MTVLPEVEGSGLPVLLTGRVAYVRTQANLQVVDLASGEVLEVITPEHPARTVNAAEYQQEFYALPPIDIAAPVTAEIQGTPVVLAPFHVRIPGQGTIAPHEAIELLVVTVDEAQVIWRMVIDLPAWAEPNARAAPTSTVRVVGTSGGMAVLTLSENNRIGPSKRSISFSVDLDSQKVVWERDGFAGAAVSGDIVVGSLQEDEQSREHTLAGMSLSDGVEVWRDEDRHLSSLAVAAGPNWVVTAKNRRTILGSQPGNELVLVQPATGDVVDLLPDAQLGPCLYDAEALIVCAAEEGSEGTAFALDAVTGELLWKLPDADGTRIAPHVTSVWHGLVYGSTADGEVVLEARTGQDVELDPGIAPYLVNEYVGITVPEPSQNGGATPRRPTVHRTIG
ncbi:hypothetical protein [Streptomyces alkaliphilus]|uniref:hypothetical protein n=1 Tax=Streptomyces alkaliphilus TaxID=1472722 RepID=UPI0011805672|nr:hypothetical protein [Streptomyces alkaliphilus]MQS06003.1 hypothetical protein [Streptomyces alkaliphilus]